MINLGSPAWYRFMSPPRLLGPALFFLFATLTSSRPLADVEGYDKESPLICVYVNAEKDINNFEVTEQICDKDTIHCENIISSTHIYMGCSNLTLQESPRDKKCLGYNEQPECTYDEHLFYEHTGDNLASCCCTGSRCNEDLPEWLLLPMWHRVIRAFSKITFIITVLVFLFFVEGIIEGRIRESMDKNEDEGLQSNSKSINLQVTVPDEPTVMGNVKPASDSDDYGGQAPPRSAERADKTQETDSYRRAKKNATEKKGLSNEKIRTANPMEAAALLGESNEEQH